jgi:hypothetical protein
MRDTRAHDDALMEPARASESERIRRTLKQGLPREIESVERSYRAVVRSGGKVTGGKRRCSVAEIEIRVIGKRWQFVHGVREISDRPQTKGEAGLDWLICQRVDSSYEEIVPSPMKRLSPGLIRSSFTPFKS